MEEEEPLTASELKVAELVAQGFSNQQIAGMLYISINTVKSHLRNCFRKLGVNQRGAIAAKLQPNNWSLNTLELVLAAIPLAKRDLALDLFAKGRLPEIADQLAMDPEATFLLLYNLSSLRMTQLLQDLKLLRRNYPDNR